MNIDQKHRHVLYATHSKSLETTDKTYLTLQTTQNDTPKLLGDFDGGTAEIENGYAGQISKYEIKAIDKMTIQLIGKAAPYELYSEDIRAGQNIYEKRKNEYVKSDYWVITESM